MRPFRHSTIPLVCAVRCWVRQCLESLDTPWRLSRRCLGRRQGDGSRETRGDLGLGMKFSWGRGPGRGSVRAGLAVARAGYLTTHG